MGEARKVEIVSEIWIEAPVERVWKAVCDEQPQWYPHSYGRDRLKRIVTEPRVGGTMYEDWGDGAGHLYSHITHWDPPTTLGTRGALRGGIVLEHWYTFAEDDGGTVLTQTTITFGAIDDDMETGIRSHGDLSRFESSLRAWVEKGEPVVRD